MKIEDYPELIDAIVQRNIAQGERQEFFGKWFIAKPLGLNSLIKRIRHAYLVLIGKAQAYMYYEDADPLLKHIEKLEKENKPKNHGRIFRFIKLLLKDTVINILKFILIMFIISIVVFIMYLIGCAVDLFLPLITNERLNTPEKLAGGVFLSIPLMMLSAFMIDYFSKLWHHSYKES